MQSCILEHMCIHTCMHTATYTYLHIHLSKNIFVDTYSLIYAMYTFACMYSYKI